MKSIFTIFLALLCPILFAQNIPNGDFEEWQTRDHFKPNYWQVPARNVHRVDNAPSGTYALKLANTLINDVSERVIAKNIDLLKPKEYPGFAYVDGPLSMVFWTDYALATGDTAKVTAVFKENGRQIGTSEIRIHGSSEGKYVQYSVPIDWSQSRTPDSLFLHIYSSMHARVNGYGYITIDDLHFEKVGTRTQEIPNYDFEEWTNIGIHYPRDWRSVDLLIYDTYNSFSITRSVDEVAADDAYQGNHSLKVQNYNHFGTLQSGYNFVGTHHNYLHGKGFAIADSFKYLEGYYRYETTAIDSARLMFRTWTGNEAFSYDNLFLHPTSRWLYFNLPISYSNDVDLADSAAFVAWSSNITPARDLNSSLYLDDLKLVVEPSQEYIPVLPFVDPIHVYPSPFQNIIYITSRVPVDKCTITDLLGRTVEADIIKNSIDMSYYKSGLYFITLWANNEVLVTHKMYKNDHL